MHHLADRTHARIVASPPEVEAGLGSLESRVGGGLGAIPIWLP